MNIGFRYPVAHRGQGFPRPRVDAPSGGGYIGISYCTTTSTQIQYSSSAYATKGRMILPLINMRLRAMLFRIIAVSGASYVARVIKLSNDGTITDVLFTSDAYVALASEETLIKFFCDVPLDANTKYGMVITRTDSTATYVLPIFCSASGTFYWINLPTAETVAGILLASNAPTVNDTVKAATAAFQPDIFVSYDLDNI